MRVVLLSQGGKKIETPPTVVQVHHPQPHPSQIHGQQCDNYSYPKKRPFSNSDRSDWQRERKLSYGGNSRQGRGGERHHPYDQHRHKEHHDGDRRPREEPHCSSESYQPKTPSRKRPHEQDNSDRDHRGHRDSYDRHHHDPKRRRTEEIRPHQQEFRRMSDPIGYHGQGPSDHHRSFRPEKSGDSKMSSAPPSKYYDPRSPHAQKAPHEAMSVFEHRSPLQGLYRDQKISPGYNWHSRKT
ncbi:chromodomain-helicase-DNA-binding protein 2-like [Anolis carolinensis]|uniref:chromodomain-helicase-DNA-binding protein 2-like n=1 Tax=Anolis carolinensis TaxID=28377 RepID=UPI002F2B27C7